jgi:hypothetical protein
VRDRSICPRNLRAHMCRYVRADAWCARRSGAMFCTATTSADRQFCAPRGELMVIPLASAR